MPSPQSSGDEKAVLSVVSDLMPTAFPAEPADCADRAFAEAMIGHYESSIATAELMLRRGADACLQWLAEGIIASHQRDLELLQSWVERCERGSETD